MRDTVYWYVLRPDHVAIFYGFGWRHYIHEISYMRTGVEAECMAFNTIMACCAPGEEDNGDME